MTGQNLYGQRFLKKKNNVGSKKIKNICLNYSVANTDRPVIFKTNDLEETLNDADRVFENRKYAVMHFNQFRNIGCKTLRI